MVACSSLRKRVRVPKESECLQGNADAAPKRVSGASSQENRSVSMGTEMQRQSVIWSPYIVADGAVVSNLVDEIREDDVAISRLIINGVIINLTLVVNVTFLADDAHFDTLFNIIIVIEARGDSDTTIGNIAGENVDLAVVALTTNTVVDEDVVNSVVDEKQTGYPN
ncbi:hypothetical protein NDU88_005092 [Pleurodeles waltl]|uniref:Uncharacterized protein n=1 Tax=Pleurodeles waltl TaxID=8319 RepID=A0AAV7L242_PLEWA|nr:hypothetical protein NDU88_005092 [Pleurodeles waltl]